MTPRSLRTRWAGGLSAVLAAVLLTSLAAPVEAMPPRAAVTAGSTAAATTAAPGGDPSQDYPRMPGACVSPDELIPTEPVVCALNGFDAGRPTVMLWGDSHAWMFIPAVRAAAEGRDVNLVAVVLGSCPPLDHAVGTGPEVAACYRSNALGIRAARRLAAGDQPYRIILSGSWERYVHARTTGDHRSYIGRMADAMYDGLPRLVETLGSLGADVDVIAQVPTVPARRDPCAAGDEPYACPVPRARALPQATPIRDYLDTTLRPLLGSRAVIDVTPSLCTARACNGTVGSTLTWFDDLHLSATMSTELASYFQPAVDAVAPPPPEETMCTVPIICP